MKENEVIERIEDFKRFADLVGSPDEFFQHMQGHRVELSLVLCMFDVAENVDLIINVLEEKKNNQWIPVSEGWPDNEPSYISGTTYYITLKTGVVRSAKYKESKWIGEFGKLYADNEVIAWKKNIKPKPYKEGVE